MQEVKDSRRAQVHLAYDGRVIKRYKGTQAKERFENEWKVLTYLEKVGCDFVPKVLQANPDRLELITTSCGRSMVDDTMRESKVKHLFDCLESYGVRHGDQAQRNITYDRQKGKFCIIDFEYATILTDPHHVSPLPFPDRAVEDQPGTRP